jgi:hypothetical protein
VVPGNSASVLFGIKAEREERGEMDWKVILALGTEFAVYCGLVMISLTHEGREIKKSQLMLR